MDLGPSAVLNFDICTYMFSLLVFLVIPPYLVPNGKNEAAIALEKATKIMKIVRKIGSGVRKFAIINQSFGSESS